MSIFKKIKLAVLQGYNIIEISDSTIDIDAKLVDVVISICNSNGFPLYVDLPLKYCFSEYTTELRSRIKYVSSNHPFLTAVEDPRPNPACVYNLDTNTWQDLRSLAEARVIKWNEIKNSRSFAEYSGFSWNGNIFDSDPTSQQRLTGAVTLAQLNPAFSIEWTLMDNTTITLNSADMLDVGITLGQHVTTQFSCAQALRTDIDNATTLEQVDSITWAYESIYAPT